MGGMEGGIRVPTVAMWPGVIPPGLEIHQPTSMMDVLPTVVNLAGAKLPNRPLDGHDLMPLLKNETVYTDHRILVHYCGEHIHAARFTPENSKLNEVWALIVSQRP